VHRPAAIRLGAAEMFMLQGLHKATMSFSFLLCLH
jgi:hypothetical protein